MPTTGRGLLVFLITSVVMFSVGFFIVTRIRPLWAAIQPRAAE